MKNVTLIFGWSAGSSECSLLRFTIAFDVLLVKSQVNLEPHHCSVSSCDLETKPPLCAFLLCKLSGDVEVKVNNKQYSIYNLS